MARRAADLIVDCLAAHGVDRVFCVPGESYLSVLDALHDSNAIQTVVCRHESGAGFMAVGDAKMTGRPGIAFVSRGPGATNASIAVHVAEQDAVPLVLFVGQVPRGEIGRRSFQEVDYAKTFADMAKAVYLIHDPARVPEIVARAFVEAQAPTPGPVVVVLPEDMLEEATEAGTIEPVPVPRAGAPSPAAIAEIAARIAKAERPLLIAGGPGIGTACGRAALRAASEAHHLPVVLSFKRQDYFPNTHANYAGHLGFKIPKPAVARYLEADLILAVGTRLTEVTTQGYTLPASPLPRQPLIHIHDDPRQIGRNYSAVLPLVADPVAVLEALAAIPGKAPAKRAAWIKKLNEPVAKAMAWSPPADGLLDMGAIVAALTERAERDAIFVTDAGNFSGWLHRYFPFSGAPADRLRRRRHGHRHAGLGGGGAAPAPSAGDPFPGRRRRPDDGLRAGDRRAVWRQRQDLHLQQRQLRHHPHAPGDRLPAPRARHRPQEPRLRQMGRELRRAGPHRRQPRGGAGGRGAGAGARRPGSGRREDRRGAHRPLRDHRPAVGMRLARFRSRLPVFSL